MRRAHPGVLNWIKRGKGVSELTAAFISLCFLIVMSRDQPCLTSPGMPAPLPCTVPSNHGPEQLLPLLYCFWAGLSNEECNEYKLLVDPLQKYYWNPYARLLWEWLSLLNAFAYFLSYDTPITSTTQCFSTNFLDSWDTVSWIKPFIWEPVNLPVH